MADEKVVKTVLKYEVDQPSVNKAEASTKRIKRELKELDDKSKQSINRLESLTQSAARSLSGLGLGALGDVGGVASDVLQLKGAFQDIQKTVKEVDGGLIGVAGSFASVALPVAVLTGSLALLKGIMDNLQSSAQKAAEAQRAQFEAMKEADERRFAAEKEARTKTAEANQQEISDVEKQLGDLSKRRADLQAERRKVNEAFTALGGALNPGERSRLGALGQELDKQIQETAEAYTKLSKRLGELVVVVDPLIEKRDKEEAATKKLTAAWDEMAEAMRNVDDRTRQASMNIINARLNSQTEAEEKAAKDRADAEDRVIDATRKANADIESIETRSLEQRARNQDQYNQRIVDITRQAADAAASALTTLTQQRQDLATELSRDFGKAERDARAQELDIRIDAQREEARSLREHERNKQRILEDSRDREFELILNRDFLGLFNLRRQTGRDLGRADTDFVAQRQERQIAGNDQLSDLRRQLVQERQERLIAYQQQLADAQLSYNRELQQIAQRRAQELLIVAQTRNAELNQLRATTTAALTLRRNQAAEEIRTAGLVGQARINFLNQERQLLLRQSATYSNASIGGTAARAALRDGGGPLRAGQLAAIGVPGEAFNGYALPSPGLFMPTVPGNVTKHTTVSNSWSISGNNPDQIGRVVRGQVEGLLRAYLT